MCDDCIKLSFLLLNLVYYQPFLNSDHNHINVLQVASSFDHAYEAKNQKSSDYDQLPAALQHNSAALSISPVSVLELPAESHNLEADDVDEQEAADREKEDYEFSSLPVDDKGYHFFKPVTKHFNTKHKHAIYYLLISGFF